MSGFLGNVLPFYFTELALLSCHCWLPQLFRSDRFSSSGFKIEEAGLSTRLSKFGSAGRACGEFPSIFITIRFANQKFRSELQDVVPWSFVLRHQRTFYGASSNQTSTIPFIRIVAWPVSLHPWSPRRVSVPMTGLVSPTSDSWTNGTAGFDLRNEMIRYVRSCPLRGFILISTFCCSLSEPHEFRQPSLGARMSLWRVRFYIVTSMIWRSSRDGKRFVSRFFF